MVIKETNINELGMIKDQNNLPSLIITSIIPHKWKVPLHCEYKDDVRDPKRIVEILNSPPFYAADRAEEYSWLVCMKTHGELIGIYNLSHGGLNVAVMDYRVIMMKVLLAGSAHFVLVHNHPTGNPKPSAADIKLTKELNQISMIHNIDFYDHLIIGKDGYSSVFRVAKIKNNDDFEFLHRALVPDNIDEE